MISFNFVEIRLGSMAGWWCRTEEQRLELIKHARGMGQVYAQLAEAPNAIRVCGSDDAFEYLQRISGCEQAIVETLPSGIATVCTMPAGFRDDEAVS